MKNFFKGISFTQVLAGSLAAVTSFLLASKIGIAGSVIGVAIGSIVSAVASQLYQNVIHASSKKLSEVKPNNPSKLSNDDVETLNIYPASKAELRKAGYKVVGDDANMAYSQQNSDANSGRTVSSKARNPEVENTRILELSALREQREEDMALSENSVPEPIPLSKAVRSTYATSPNEGAYSRGNNHKVTILIAIMSALLGVIVTAGVVLLFTQGKGTDNINQPEPVQQQQTPKKQRTNTDNNYENKNPSNDNSSDQNSSNEDDDKNKNMHNGEDGDASSQEHNNKESGKDTTSNGAGSNSVNNSGGGAVNGDTSGSGSGAAGGIKGNGSTSVDSGSGTGSTSGGSTSGESESSSGSTSTSGGSSSESAGN